MAVCQHVDTHSSDPKRRARAAARPGCGKLLGPGRAGLCDDCVKIVAPPARCYRCGGVDGEPRKNCLSLFHGINRGKGGARCRNVT